MEEGTAALPVWWSRRKGDGVNGSEKDDCMFNGKRIRYRYELEYGTRFAREEQSSQRDRKDFVHFLSQHGWGDAARRSRPGSHLRSSATSLPYRCWP